MTGTACLRALRGRPPAQRRVRRGRGRRGRRPASSPPSRRPAPAPAPPWWRRTASWAGRRSWRRSTSPACSTPGGARSSPASAGRSWRRRCRRGGADLPDFSVDPGRAHWRHQIRVNRFVYATVLDDLCLAAGVRLRFHEMPAAVRPLSGDGAAGEREAGTGRTGAGRDRQDRTRGAGSPAPWWTPPETPIVAGLMGYARRQSEHLQPGTLIYELDGYDLARVDLEALAARYAAARARGEILPTDHTGGRAPPVPGAGLRRGELQPRPGHRRLHVARRARPPS